MSSGLVAQVGESLCHGIPERHGRSAGSARSSLLAAGIPGAECAVDRVFENDGVCGFEIERTNEVAVKAVDCDEIAGMKVVRRELADGLAELRDKFVLLFACIDQDDQEIGSSPSCRTYLGMKKGPESIRTRNLDVSSGLMR